MPKRLKEFEYHEDGKHIMTGTVPELAEALGVPELKIRNLAGWRNRERYYEGRVNRMALPLELPERIFALYRGEDLVSIGTIEEIAEETGLETRAVRWYTTPSAKKRSGKMSMVELEGEL